MNPLFPSIKSEENANGSFLFGDGAVTIISLGSLFLLSQLIWSGQIKLRRMFLCYLTLRVNLYIMVQGDFFVTDSSPSIVNLSFPDEVFDYFANLVVRYCYLSFQLLFSVCRVTKGTFISDETLFPQKIFLRSSPRCY